MITFGTAGIIFSIWGLYDTAVLLNSPPKKPTKEGGMWPFRRRSAEDARLEEVKKFARFATAWYSAKKKPEDPKEVSKREAFAASLRYQLPVLQLTAVEKLTPLPAATLRKTKDGYLLVLDGKDGTEIKFGGIVDCELASAAVVLSPDLSAFVIARRPARTRLRARPLAASQLRTFARVPSQRAGNPSADRAVKDGADGQRDQRSLRELAAALKTGGEVVKPESAETARAEKPRLEPEALLAAIEDKWGVKVGAVASGPGGTGPGPEPTKTEDVQTEFTVVLKSGGAAKINVIKVVREVTGLGLEDAKDLVDGAPKDVKARVSKAEADEISKKLKEAGAEVEVNETYQRVRGSLARLSTESVGASPAPLAPDAAGSHVHEVATEDARRGKKSKTANFETRSAPQKAGIAAVTSADSASEPKLACNVSDLACNMMRAQSSDPLPQSPITLDDVATYDFSRYEYLISPSSALGHAQRPLSLAAEQMLAALQGAGFDTSVYFSFLSTIEAAARLAVLSSGQPTSSGNAIIAAFYTDAYLQGAVGQLFATYVRMPDGGDIIPTYELETIIQKRGVSITRVPA